MSNQALDDLSSLIPREHAALALTWFAARIETMVQQRDKAMDALFGFSMDIGDLITYRDATDDLVALKHSLDSFLAPEEKRS